MTDKVTSSERIEDILARVPIFSRLDHREIRKLAKLCVPCAFGAGETVIEEGSLGLGLFVVISGRIEILKRGVKSSLALGAMEEGDILGEIALMDDQPRSASAVAKTYTECLLLTRDSFETLIKKEPDIAWCIVPVLADRIRELHARAVGTEQRLRAAEAAVEAGRRSTSGKGANPGTPENGADVTTDEIENETEETSGTQDAVTKMLRMQYGVMLGGMTGMTGMVRLWETFFKELAEETNLAETEEFSDLMDRAPDSFVAASRKAISDLEELPKDMVDSFRSVYKNE